MQLTDNLLFLLCYVYRIDHIDASQDDSAPHKRQVHCGVLNPLGFGRASHLAWTLVPSSPASSASASSASTFSSSASISDEHRAETPHPFEHQQPQSVCLFHVPPHFVDETDAVTLAAAEQLKAQLEHDQQQQAKKSKRLSLFGGFQSSQPKSASTGHEGTLWRLKKKAVVASLQATLLATNRPSEHGSHPSSSLRAVALKPLTLRLQESPTSPPSAAPGARRGSRDATAAPPTTTTDGSEGTAMLASDVRDVFSGPVATITYLLPKSTQLVSQMFSLQHLPSHPPPPHHHEQSQRQGHPQDKQEMDGGGESHASSASRAVCNLTAVSPLLPPMASLHWHAISNPKTTTTASPFDSGRYEAEGILQQNRADPLLHSSPQTLRFLLRYRSSPTGDSSAILSSGTGCVE